MKLSLWSSWRGGGEKEREEEQLEMQQQQREEDRQGPHAQLETEVQDQQLELEEQEREEQKEQEQESRLQEQDQRAAKGGEKLRRGETSRQTLCPCGPKVSKKSPRSLPGPFDPESQKSPEKVEKTPK